jgi:uncharacterized membrane protein YbaN (DUF454 family)
MRRTTVRATKRGIKQLGGVLLLLLGVLGLIMPVLPGIPFLLAAIAVLGAEHWLIQPWLRHLKRLTAK